MVHNQNEKHFFLVEMTTADHQFSETFFYQNIKCFESCSILCDFFSQKSATSS